MIKRPFRRLLFVFVLGSSLVSAKPTPTPPASPSPAQPGDTIIILDASGSMNERIRGESKIVIARRAVRELVGSLPAGTRLGLVAYSHRRNRCDDFELLIPPGPLDPVAFIAAVEALKPNGRTPISAALTFTAHALDATRHKASIILVSDGLETCGGDPCATVAKLAQESAGLTVHAVAFDLSARDAKAFACLAAATNGRFLQANDAATLQDALVVAVTEATGPAPVQPPVEDLSPATISVPAEVRAGAEFAANWTGPDNPGDFLCIVPQGSRDDVYENNAYTRQGRTLSLTALLDPGAAEVRYVASRSGKVLGRAPILITPITVTLAAADEAIAGSPLQVSWAGPNNRGDYLTVVPRAAPDQASARYVDIAGGSPAGLTTPIEPGEYEIRYLSGQGHRVLARRALRVVPAVITLEAPAEVVAGAPVEVRWTGPDHENDFLVILPATAADGAWRRSVATRLGSPAKLTAPIEPGPAEVRYISGEGHKVLARRAIGVKSAAVTLDGPAEAIAGSEVQVVWTGPDNDNDFLVIVARNAADGVWRRTTYTRAGSPAKVAVPIEPGEAEVRYLSGIGHKVLARRPLTIRAATITLDAPAEVIAGSKVAVVWTGSNQNNDFLAVTAQSAPDGAWARTSYVRAGSPTEVAVPIEPGEGEIRYLSGEGHKVLARRPLKIVAATIALDAPAAVVAGAEVPVIWTGPNHENDFMAIVPQAAPDGAWSQTSYTRVGSPLKLRAPIVAGPSEIRYYAGTGYKVLARRPILVEPQQITLDAPAEAVAGSTVAVTWNGSANADDFIAITLQTAADGAWSRVSYARNGSPVTVAVPATAGEGEIRYFTGIGNKVLVRRSITIVPAAR